MATGKAICLALFFTLLAIQKITTITLPTSSAAKTTVGRIYQNYSDVTEPSTGLVTTPKPHLDKCRQDIKAVVTALKRLDIKDLWAEQLIDAWGKPPAGILQGTLKWPGSYSECKSLTASYTENNITYSFKGDYNNAFMNFSNVDFEFPAALKPFETLTYGYCIPDSCKPSDFKTIFNEIESLLKVPAVVKLLLEAILQHGVYTHVPDSAGWDWRTTLGVVVGSIFCFIITIGTLFDIYTRYKKKMAVNDTDIVEQETNIGDLKRVGSTRSLNAEGDKFDTNEQNVLQPAMVMPKKSQQELLGDILLSFSAYKNGEKILNTSNTNEKNIACLHGIRFLSMSWVILGHTYFFSLAFLSKLSAFFEAIDNFAFQAISVGGSFSVDTFFLLSGTLVSYLFFNNLSVVGSLKKIGWAKFYLHRFWRLTPAYMLILCVYVCLFRYLGSGPFWDVKGNEVDFCKDTWWTNLLYINNFVKTDHMCIGWTWYLANDMQFYVISPLILIPLALSKIAGLAVILVFFVISFSVSSYVIVHDHFEGGNLMALTANGKFMPDYYMKPYIRIGPYLIGLILGYILSKTKFTMKINKIYVLVGWALATALNLSVVYGLYHAHPNEDTWRSYMVLSRTAWGIGVAWVIFACTHGYGGYVNTLLSWKAFIPLSRLTYCAYLIHPIVMFYFYKTRQTLIEPLHTVMVPYFFNYMVVAYAISFLLSVAFESPMMNIEKLLLQRKKD